MFQMLENIMLSEKSKSQSEVKWKSLSRARLFATPWIQPMEFSRPEYWSG